MGPISRRTFLAATSGALVAAACGGSNGSARYGGASDFVGLRAAADLYTTSRPQRFAFALQKHDRYFDGAAASVAFRSPAGELGRQHATKLRDEGLPENRGIYDTEGVFEEAGIWDAEIEVEAQLVEMPFQVNPLPETLVPGEPAYDSPSPTPTDPLGVDPICTREPECGLHEVSLEAVVGSGRPVAVMFATPARCRTAICGPVLEMLLDVKGPFEDHIEVVHVEIFRSLEGPEHVPTVDAWTLENEPWLFTIDGGGRVLERLGGGFDRGQVRELLQRLATSEPQDPPEGT